MKYERLKENIETLCVHNERHIPVYHITDGKKHEIDLIREIVSDCKGILNKIEQGTLIELPCKVGDTVYKIMHVCGKRMIVEFKVKRISIYKDEVCIFFHKQKEGWHEWCTKPHHFGVNIFLTHEEAEKRLKELQE